MNIKTKNFIIVARVDPTGPTPAGAPVELEGITFGPDGSPTPEPDIKWFRATLPTYLGAINGDEKKGWDGVWWAAEPSDKLAKDARYNKNGTINDALVAAFQGTPEQDKSVEDAIRVQIDVTRDGARKSLKKTVTTMRTSYFQNWANNYEVKDTGYITTQCQTKWDEGIHSIEQELAAYGNLMAATYARNFGIDIGTLHTYTHRRSNSKDAVAYGSY